MRVTSISMHFLNYFLKGIKFISEISIKLHESKILVNVLFALVVILLAKILFGLGGGFEAVSLNGNFEISNPVTSNRNKNSSHKYHTVPFQIDDGKPNY